MLLRALMFVAGVAGALAPRRLIDLVGRVVLAGYENPEALEPAEWYVTAVRTKFAVIAVAALIAPFLPTPSVSGDEEPDAEAGPVVEVIEGGADA